MDKLELQSVCFEKIKSICVNYSKDSSSRKNEDYLNKRFSSLESLWNEFENRHALLVLELEDKGINYFADDIYERTKKMYVSTTGDITRRLSDLEKRSQLQNVTFDLEGTDIQLDCNENKLQLLINKQECNINAIYRAMAKISSKAVSEQWQLDDHLATLKAKWDPIDKQHSEIDFQLKGSNEHYYEMFSEVERKYDDLKTKLNAQIWSTAHFQKSAPKIELPEFSGGYNQWISFKDLFLETIDKNPTINNAQKMHHLKTKLRGEAESLVQHLPVSSDNYSSCWDILIQRYDNRRRLFTSYLNTMLELPNIQNPDSFNLKKMHDVITECLNGMSNIGVDLTISDPVIAHLMYLKLDDKTMDNYVKEIQDKRELPNSQEFLEFLEKEFMGYETKRCAKKGIPSIISEKATTNKFNKQTMAKRPNFNTKRTYNYYLVNTKCPFCTGNHVLRQCDKFLELDIVKRNTTVSKLQLCKNCLYRHENNICNSTKTCRECNMRHHTLLHNSERKVNTNLPYRKSNMNQQPSSSQQATSNHLYTDKVQVLLTTVQLKVKSIDGTFVTLRALLDQGSQVNLITENAAQILRLPRKKINACITGIGAVSGDCRGQVMLECQSIHSDFGFEIQALIMKRLTANLPSTTFEKSVWPHLENIKLADPTFNTSSHVDLLLGADVYSEIILEGVLRGNNLSPVAQQTQLGWILCGKMKTFNCHVTVLNMEDLTKFWETEDISKPEDIPKDDKCEIFYTQTVQRRQDGSYVVKMPLCSDYEDKLGKSKAIATLQYLQLEKRFHKNNKLSDMYKQFIKEYAELGHLKPSTQMTNNSCYLPHHGVLKENSTTTKLRVVFNASQRTSSGYSLNNLMEKGPNLQKDIQSLILKWRTYKYAFTADIEKMYRCIWLSEDQQHLQKIIWRDSYDQALNEYQLCTVTYGTKAAPWLAMRTLQQLAIDDGHKYPEAVTILQTECFVDDVISGHNRIQDAQRLQQSLIQLLKGGGMNLRKWTSNHRALYENLNPDQIATQNDFHFKTDEHTKTLGLSWNPSKDYFHFNWPMKEAKRLTKRLLLSNISNLFDPLGWLSPVTILAKLLFQRLWMTNLSWDDRVPSDIENEWIKLKTELPLIKTMTLSRWIGDTQQQIQLLGFCDASEKAYACVIYSRVKNEYGQPIITLLAAKTRVAPRAQKITLPRLELCGALLLAELMEKTKEAFSTYNVTIEAWCDSQVVLAWIQGESAKWEAYITNRVTKIRRIIPGSNWRYIKSEQNPADCASRGLQPSKLMNFNLWWQGPDWLLQGNFQNISRAFETNCDCVKYDETKQNTLTIKLDNEHFISMLLNKYSSLSRVTRVVAWIRRFIINIRHMTKSETTYLTTCELSAANKSIIIHVQSTQFNPEYSQLKKKENISRKSPLFKLNPYLDEMGITRVGGRLRHCSLSPDMKNPVIIPHKGRFTQLLIEQAHANTLHGGARLSLNYIRQRYWVVGGNRAVKTCLRKCVRCHRFNKTQAHQLMGDLPRPRITPCRPFFHTGVDFTGHIEIKLNKGRGVKTSKGYIAIFICMATKAVHIELVSDLSTDAFIAALQRLCARRGTPKHMYSDCGTNFIGAAKVLRHEFELFKELLTDEFFNELTKLEIEWHFNAPAWPQAGGLWEAAVKAMKHHLRRVLGDQKLTFEEFTTLLSKIEACLNSRPLCPLTEDPEEFYNCLTPGHFLTGSPTLSLPLSDYNDINNIDLRRRWQLVEHMFHQYWKNWSNDYLTTLQTRSKWNTPTRNIKKGDIVLVKENTLPPGKWALGRVMETHPGPDGYVRVTTLKTKNGIIKRPVVKLSPLPLNNEIDDNKEEKSESTSDEKSDYKQRQKGNKVISTLLITLLTLFTFVHGSNGISVGARLAPNTQITSMERERPMYYDTYGKMQVVHDKWTLIMYYNLTNYWEGTRRIEAYYEHVRNTCEQTKLIHCRTTIEQLRHEMEQLNYYNSVLINPHKHLSNKKKRGLVDGVGYVANSLFGILDQRFAEKYQNDIQSLQENENYMMALIKNQTSILELENQVLKKSESALQYQFDLIDSYVNQTNENVAAIESQMGIIAATTYLNSATLTAYLLINNLKTFQEMLFNTLTNVYQGHVDVHLITPVHLIQKLNEISGNLPKTVMLPVENYQENIKDLYELITVKARVTDYYFLFEANIPLVSNDDYTLYRAIPLPVKTMKGFTYVQITTTYIAINFKKGVYISLNEDNFKQCIRQTPNKYLCSKSLPAYDLHSQNAPCEAKLLSHQNNAPCDVVSASCKAGWIELHTSNSWLVTCCDTCLLQTICDDEVKNTAISTTSVITLSQGCVLKSGDLTIYASHQYQSQMEMDYALTVPALNTTINNIVNLTYLSTSDTRPSIRSDVTRIDDKISTLKENEVTRTWLTTHDIHHYVISYVLLGAAISALVVVGRNRCRRNRTKNTTHHHEDIELQEIRRSTNISKNEITLSNDTTAAQQPGSSHQGQQDVRIGTRNIAFDFN